MQSDKTLTTQIYFLLTTQRTESFLNETMLQVNKERSMRRNSKFNQHFLNKEISKVLKVISFYFNSP